MKISELSHATGVSTYRLRHYEKLGLIHAERGPSGYREFAESAVRAVMFIAKCREVGVSLKDIAKVLPAYCVGTLTFDDMIDLMNKQIKQVDEQLSQLMTLRAELSSALGWFRQKKRKQNQTQPRSKSIAPETRGFGCQIRKK